MAPTKPATRELAAAAMPTEMPSAIASSRARRVALRTRTTIACSSSDTHILLVGRGLFLGFGVPDPGLQRQQREHEDPQPAPIVALHAIDTRRRDGSRRAAPPPQLRFRNRQYFRLPQVGRSTEGVGHRTQ